MKGGAALENTAAENRITVSDVRVSFHNLKHMSIHQMIRNPAFGKTETTEALRGVSFSVGQGEIVGMIGRNGSGKTTLLKTISGIIQSDSGTVETGGQRISLMTLGAGFKDAATGRDNIMISGMLMDYPAEYIKAKMDEIIEFSELGEFIDRPVRTYSSGMFAKLSFAITAILEMDVMLVDEILSVGDEHFQQKSFERMRELITNEKRTGLIVSHDLDALREICTRVIWIHDGLVRMDGGTDEVIDAYARFMTYDSEVSGHEQDIRG